MTKISSSIRVFSIISLTLSVAVHAARGDEPLRWKFTKDQSIHYTMTQKTLSKTEAGGQKLEFTQNQDTDMTWKITKVDASGNAEMDQTIDRIVLTTTGPAGEMKVDTKTEPGPEENGPIGMAAKVLRGMVGSPFHMKMSVQGDISDVTVPPESARGLEKSWPRLWRHVLGRGYQADDRSGHDRLARESRHQRATPGSRTRAYRCLSARCSWTALTPTKALKVPLLGSVSCQESTSSHPKTQTMSVKLVSSDGKGEYRFDPKAGMLRESEMNMKMTMQIKVGGQEMATEVDSTTKMHEGGSAAK